METGKFSGSFDYLYLWQTAPCLTSCKWVCVHLGACMCPYGLTTPMLMTARVGTCVYIHIFVCRACDQRGGPCKKVLELASLQDPLCSSLVVSTVPVLSLCLLYGSSLCGDKWPLPTTTPVFAPLGDCPRAVKIIVLATVWASELSTQKLLQDQLESSGSWMEERTHYTEKR